MLVDPGGSDRSVSGSVDDGRNSLQPISKSSVCTSPDQERYQPSSPPPAPEDEKRYRTCSPPSPGDEKREFLNEPSYRSLSSQVNRHQNEDDLWRDVSRDGASQQEQAYQPTTMTYEWITKYVVDMNRPSYLNDRVSVRCSFLRVPKSPSFLHFAYVAQHECLHCKKLNDERPRNAEPIPCIVNMHYGRCMLCFVTQRNDADCCARTLNPEIQRARAAHQRPTYNDGAAKWTSEQQSMPRDSGYPERIERAERIPQHRDEEPSKEAAIVFSTPSPTIEAKSKVPLAVRAPSGSSSLEFSDAGDASTDILDRLKEIKESQIAGKTHGDIPKSVGPDARKRAHFAGDEKPASSELPPTKARKSDSSQSPIRDIDVVKANQAIPAPVQPSSASTSLASSSDCTVASESVITSFDPIMNAYMDMRKELDRLRHQHELDEKEKRVLQESRRILSEKNLLYKARIAELEAERERARLRGENEKLKRRVAEIEAAQNGGRRR